MTRAGIDPFHRNVGHRVSTRRHQLGLTQHELAHLTGIPRPTLSQIENGYFHVPLYRAHAIAQALRTTLDHLTGLPCIDTCHKDTP